MATAERRTWQATLVDVTAELGIDASVARGANGVAFMPDSMTGGIALLDANGDDRLDIYLVHGVRDANGARQVEAGRNRLFLQSADGRFAESPEPTGLEDDGYGMGAAVGDVDGDGDDDVYVTNLGPDRLYRNDGGRFKDITREARIEGGEWSASAGFRDLDGDGALDLFVVHYVGFDQSIRGSDAGGAPEFPSPRQFAPTVDRLYINRGDGTFEDASVASGLATRAGRGLGLAFLDIDENGFIDVLVANDGEPNFAWLNDGAARFREEGMSRGLAVDLLGRPEASMGVACGDVDGDGFDDVLLTHLVQETNTLYRRTAPGLYDDATAGSGLGPPSLDRTGFGAALVDLDLDGDLDALVANGRVLRGPTVAGVAADVAEHWRAYAEPGLAFRNDGRGRFTVDPALGGDFARDARVARGLACGDLDDDGDLDVVVATACGSLRVYRNDLPRAGRPLVVRALRSDTGALAHGATVTVRLDDGRVLRRSTDGVSSYLVAGDRRAHFGIPSGAGIRELVVRWPDGLVERFPPPREEDPRVDLVRGAGTEPEP